MSSSLEKKKIKIKQQQVSGFSTGIGLESDLRPSLGCSPMCDISFHESLVLVIKSKCIPATRKIVT